MLLPKLTFFSLDAAAAVGFWLSSEALSCCLSALSAIWRYFCFSWQVTQVYNTIQIVATHFMVWYMHLTRECFLCAASNVVLNCCILDLSCVCGVGVSVCAVPSLVTSSTHCTHDSITYCLSGFLKLR